MDPAIPVFHACETYGLSLDYQGDNTWAGSLVCWPVDADGAALDDGESSIECSITFEHGRAYRGLTVYGPAGEPLELHPTAAAELARACDSYADGWITSERAEARREGCGISYPGRHS
jgi:hypothetical protein